MIQRVLPAMLALMMVAGNMTAYDSGPVRRAVEKGGNWLVGQYDNKTKTFTNVQAPEQLAMAVKALCDNPRDYKEANGPYISEPVKAILAKIDADGHVAGIATTEAEAILWIITGLKATKNDDHKPVIEKLRTSMKELAHPEMPAFIPAHLQPTVASPESMRNAIAAILKVGEAGQKELDVNGTPVKWAEILGDSLVKLQQPDGSFGDVQTSALALYILNLCLKAY